MFEVQATGQHPTPQYGQALVYHNNFLYTIGGTTGFAYSCDIHRHVTFLQCCTNLILLLTPTCTKLFFFYLRDIVLTIFICSNLFWLNFDFLRGGRSTLTCINMYVTQLDCLKPVSQLDRLQYTLHKFSKYFSNTNMFNFLTHCIN